jgi:hypothetical protein
MKDYERLYGPKAPVTVSRARPARKARSRARAS